MKTRYVTPRPDFRRHLALIGRVNRPEDRPWRRLSRPPGVDGDAVLQCGCAARALQHAAPTVRVLESQRVAMRWGIVRLALGIGRRRDVQGWCGQCDRCETVFWCLRAVREVT